MMTIENVKEKLRGVIAKASPSPMRDELTAVADLLDGITDPETLRGEVALHIERRRGARVRAKLDAAHGIRGKIDAVAHANHPNGNTWRDGYVRGLEDAHAHVQAMGDADIDDGD